MSLTVGAGVKEGASLGVLVGTSEGASDEGGVTVGNQVVVGHQVSVGVQVRVGVSVGEAVVGVPEGEAVVGMGVGDPVGTRVGAMVGSAVVGAGLMVGASVCDKNERVREKGESLSVMTREERPSVLLD